MALDTVRAFVVLWSEDSMVNYLPCQKFFVNGVVMIPLFKGIMFRQHLQLASIDMLITADTHDQYRIFYNPLTFLGTETQGPTDTLCLAIFKTM
jgi:hypothetical protein